MKLSNFNLREHGARSVALSPECAMGAAETEQSLQLPAPIAQKLLELASGEQRVERRSGLFGGGEAELEARERVDRERRVVGVEDEQRAGQRARLARGEQLRRERLRDDVRYGDRRDAREALAREAAGAEMTQTRAGGLCSGANL